MATLTRQQDESTVSIANLSLENGVPAPFPKDLTQQLLLDELAEEDAGLAPTLSNGGPSNVSEIPRLSVQIDVDNVRVVRVVPFGVIELRD
jgi:serine/threonine-protein kinase RIO1